MPSRKTISGSSSAIYPNDSEKTIPKTIICTRKYFGLMTIKTIEVAILKVYHCTMKRFKL